MTNLFLFKGRAYPVEYFDIQVEREDSKIITSTSIESKSIPISTHQTIEMIIPYNEFMNKRHEPTVASLHLKDKGTVVFHNFIKTRVQKINNTLEIESMCKNYDKIYS